jgi:hypothetical protein
MPWIMPCWQECVCRFQCNRALKTLIEHPKEVVAPPRFFKFPAI